MDTSPPVDSVEQEEEETIDDVGELSVPTPPVILAKLVPSSYQYRLTLTTTWQPWANFCPLAESYSSCTWAWQRRVLTGSYRFFSRTRTVSWRILIPGSVQSVISSILLRGNQSVLLSIQPFSVSG